MKLLFALLVTSFYFTSSRAFLGIDLNLQVSAEITLNNIANLSVGSNILLNGNGLGSSLVVVTSDIKLGTMILGNGTSLLSNVSLQIAPGITLSLDSLTIMNGIINLEAGAKLMISGSLMVNSTSPVTINVESGAVITVGSMRLNYMKGGNMSRPSALDALLSIVGKGSMDLLNSVLNLGADINIGVSVMIGANTTIKTNGNKINLLNDLMISGSASISANLIFKKASSLLFLNSIGSSLKLNGTVIFEQDSDLNINVGLSLGTNNILASLLQVSGELKIDGKISIVRAGSISKGTSVTIAVFDSLSGSLKIGKNSGFSLAIAPNAIVAIKI